MGTIDEYEKSVSALTSCFSCDIYIFFTEKNDNKEKYFVFIFRTFIIAKQIFVKV